MIIVGTYTSSPITADTIPSERTAFTRPSILFRPPKPSEEEIGGGAGYRPRVRAAYYAVVYRHSQAEADPRNIEVAGKQLKANSACLFFLIFGKGAHRLYWKSIIAVLSLSAFVEAIP